MAPDARWKKHFVAQRVFGESPLFTDVDGDGLPDVITGKRRWAHGPTGDAEPNGTPYISAFLLRRAADKSVSYVPRRLDDQGGIGTQLVTADINAESLPKLKDPLMALRKASKQVSDVVSAQTALATGEVDIVVGGGEWLTAVLAADNPNLDWTIPKQGGLRWAQSIGVVAGSTQPDLALEFVKYIVSPEGQARLATASCYWGMPANAKAGDALSAEAKAVLRWDQQPDFLTRAQLYPIPDAATDTAMQDMWTEMLNQ
ncbi:MAG: hypothetical protein CFE34_20005 [Rhodobacteraceae bacterium PARR1]|nr:MAG: hypothetical protein CFE34_20005 [Rhodobacteraceae bacterium PARR1]